MDRSDPDASALLEWLNSLEAAGGQFTDLAELADGEALLRVMHDLSPEGFPAPARLRDAERLPRLLEGLDAHLRDRGGSDDELCQRLLEQVRAGLVVSPARLAKLTLVATVQNDLPRRREYVEAIMGLSVEAQQAAQAIIERFLSGEGLESPSAISPGAERARFGTFSPPERSAASRGPRDTPAFMEVGLDPDQRFRRLKDEYISVMEEQERLQEQRAQLRKDLDAERERRRRAEEGEREARAELRLAEEAKERIREETRALYEGRMEQDSGRAAEKLLQKDAELEALREELSLARAQAASAERLGHQLELAKQKLEEHHTLRRENEELRVQVDDLLARKGDGGTGGAAGAHLQRSLARARDDAAAAARERDEVQRQLLAVKDELAQSQEQQRALAEQLDALRRGGGLPAASAEVAGAAAGPGRVLALEAGAALLAAATGEAAAGEAAGRPRQDDLLERLLAEKERATRAETTLQVKSAEMAGLQAQLELLKGQIASGAGGGASSKASEGKVLDLENQLVIKDRELQVLRLREAAEKESLHMQETMMASCFHELGLQFQKLRLQDKLAQLKGPAPGAGSPKR